MGRVISRDDAATWTRAHRAQAAALFFLFTPLLEMGRESLWPQGCPVFSFVYSILVKAINPKDELERWSPEVKDAAK